MQWWKRKKRWGRKGERRWGEREKKEEVGEVVEGMKVIMVEEEEVVVV